MTLCGWWLCRHPILRHTHARGCTVAGCLCHYTATEARRPNDVSLLAAIAWRNLYAVASGRGRVLVEEADTR